MTHKASPGKPIAIITSLRPHTHTSPMITLDQALVNRQVRLEVQRHIHLVRFSPCAASVGILVDDTTTSIIIDSRYQPFISTTVKFPYLTVSTGDMKEKTQNTSYLPSQEDRFTDLFSNKSSYISDPYHLLLIFPGSGEDGRGGGVFN